jgi:hypothetical protein
MIEGLASYRRCRERMTANWPALLERRRERLAQQERHGTAAERVAENILEDLFTSVLDWSLCDINHQVGFADLLRVSGIPEADIPDVLVKLARAAARLGRMPHQSGETALVYRQLAEVLEQLGRLGEIVGE